MKKKLLTLAVALLAATGAWAQRFQFGSLYFNIIDDINKLVEVTYENNSGTNYPDLSGHLEIPDRVYRNGIYYMVTRIGEDAFSGCTGITIVNTSSNNIEIGDRAFWGCENINTMFIADNVGSIGREVFSYCTRLSQVSIGRALSTIGYGAFNNCESLKEINVDAANSTFCSENGILFNKDKTTLFKYPARKSETAYLIPESVKELETCSFEFCANLEKVIIPKGITYIGGGAFWDCAVLKEIIILATTPPTLGVDVFQKGKIYVPSEAVSTYNNHDSWKYITVYPLESTFTVDNLTYEITDYTENTVKLVSCKQEGVVNIPAVVNHNGTNYTVTSMREGAFYNSKGVTQINIPSSLVEIGNNDIGNSLKNLERINVDAENPAYCSVDGILFNKDKTLLIKYPAKKPEISYVIPGSVTKIEKGAFDCNEIIKQVTIPENVTSIGSMAFNLCSALEQVNIPEGVNFIGNSAFYGSGITEIDIPAVGGTDIEPWAFASCTKLKKVSLGEGITAIGMFAFYLCSAIEEMTVHAVEPPTVEQDAFYSVNTDIPVYVPAASLDTYKAANVWKEFTNLQTITTAIHTPSMPESIRVYDGMLHNPQQLHLTLYDMQGRQVYSGTDATVSQPAGVYVVRCAGASGKVLF